MDSGSARRVRLSGHQLKNAFLSKYSDNNFTLSKAVKLVQPLAHGELPTLLIKSGANWQFRLGRIPEVEENVLRFEDEGKRVIYTNDSELESIVLSHDFLKRYAFSAGFFVARKGHNWQVFNSIDIINLLQQYCEVRVLKSGRLKYDFKDDDLRKKGIMTIEFRAESHKRNFVFGAHGGGAGEKLRAIFEHYLLFTELPV